LNVTHAFRIPLELAPQPRGGFTVSCPVLPELITGGDAVDEALANATDAFHAVLEIYEEEHRPFPDSLAPELLKNEQPIRTERLVATA
jgi:antitoxin HicB